MRALLLLLCACAPIQARSYVTGRNAKVVREVREYGSRLVWIREPWYDTLKDFLDFPRRIVIAQDDTACAFVQPPVNVPEPNTAFTCPDAWRFARNR